MSRTRLNEDDLDRVFVALANRTRRRILDIVAAHPGSAVGEVAERFDMSRIAVMKHLRVLERCGLVHSTKEGRTRKLYFNSVPIQMIYDRWTTEFSKMWASRMTRMKYRIESKGKRDG